MSYDPKPVDNSQIKLSDALNRLVEQLAANNHDLWARRRIGEKWRYGERRDDALKETPLLVPYDDLPDSEKEYARENGIESIKTIVALGWTIQDPKFPMPAEWSRDEFRSRAKQASAQGEALLACDIANQGLALWPDDVRLRKVQALALTRMGSHVPAHIILDRLKAEGHTDEETLGLSAGAYKDLWLKSGHASDLDRAYEEYLKAFRGTRASYWTGINAATLAFMKGNAQAAGDLAAQVRKICEEEKDQASPEDLHWIMATLGEAYLLLDLIPEAEEAYGRAAQLAEERVGDILSTWENARLILSLLPPAVHERIERALQVPKVAIFAGHRIDDPGAVNVRFPEGRANFVKERIQAHLLQTRARLGYSSAASGADILFLEAMQALKGRTYIALPCNEEQFVKESVAPSGEQWVRRFLEVKAHATEVIIASEERLNVGSVAYDFSNELLHGLATLRARQNGLELVHLAVWDGQESNRRGGTADIVSRWRRRTADITVIRPLDATKDQGGGAAAPGAPDSSGSALPGVRSEVRAMLFADAFHFSLLTETQMPVFVHHFMGAIAMLLRQTWPKPLFQNTWGDGLYVVFPAVAAAGHFALKLAKRVADIDRESLGLPADMTLRISLHAGPVYVYKDQIIDKENYIGSHVNRAARIEPVTVPGHIYATDAFAALAELEAPGQFRFDYVGKVPLAKKYGEFPLYDMRVSTDALHG